MAAVDKKEQRRTANGEFWAGKKVLVTGHTGFKGSWLSLWLLSRGARVTGYALAPPTTPSLFETGNLSRDMRSIEGDVRNFDSVLACIRDEQPEIVFHLAAQSLVRKSYADPKETYATNAMGTVHVLEAVRREGSVRVVVNVTSDKCYENRETGQACREMDPMGGKDPYSSSKGCAELITAAYQHSFFCALEGTRLMSARAGNVIGGGDWAEDRLIPDCIRAFMRGVPVTIRNPSSVRPWQHVLEPVSGYMLLAEKLWKGEKYSTTGFNFGPQRQEVRPVTFVVEEMIRYWGNDAHYEVMADGSKPEAGYLALDSRLAESELGWAARWTLVEALSATTEWYRAWYGGASSRELCMQQIEAYAGAPAQVPSEDSPVALV